MNPAIQAITETLTRKLLLDAKLSPLLDEISLQTLLDRQRYFLKAVFRAGGGTGIAGKSARILSKTDHSSMDDMHLDIALGHLKETLVELDVPEHEIIKLMTSLGRKNPA